jgi:hypothetical protein
MTVREALYTYLTGALAAEIGDRVYAGRAPEGTTLPYITYTRVSAVRTYFHQDFADTAPWVRERMSFAVVGITPQAVEDLGDALIGVLSGYRGDMEGVLVGLSDVVNDLDQYDPQTKLYRRVLDVFIDHEEVAVAS